MLRGCSSTALLGRLSLAEPVRKPSTTVKRNREQQQAAGDAEGGQRHSAKQEHMGGARCRCRITAGDETCAHGDIAAPAKAAGTSLTARKVGAKSNRIDHDEQGHKRPYGEVERHPDQFLSRLGQRQVGGSKGCRQVSFATKSEAQPPRPELSPQGARENRRFTIMKMQQKIIHTLQPIRTVLRSAIERNTSSRGFLQLGRRQRPPAARRRTIRHSAHLAHRRDEAVLSRLRDERDRRARAARCARRAEARAPAHPLSRCTRTATTPEQPTANRRASSAT